MQFDSASKIDEASSNLLGTTSSDKNRIIGWENLHIGTTRENEISNVHYGFAQTIDMKKQIIIDTVSSTLVICDPAYCDKIDKSDKVFYLAINGGVMHSGLKYEVDKIGEAWLNKNSLTNIFSFTYIVNKYRIKYDSKIEDKFWVYVDNKRVKFKQLANIIYVLCPGITDDEQKQLL